MKRRSLERVERRRILLELNLIADTKPPRMAIARRGCAVFSAPSVLGLAALICILGLR